jgi:hypothetical protein
MSQFAQLRGRRAAQGSITNPRAKRRLDAAFDALKR